MVHLKYNKPDFMSKTVKSKFDLLGPEKKSKFVASQGI